MFKLLRSLNFERSVEVYFIGYPKTGNTWTRYMLGRYLQLFCDSADLKLFDGTDWLGRCERAGVGPRMHFTHSPLTWDTQTAEDLTYEQVAKAYHSRRVVLLSRYPLDALVSAWLQQTHRSARRFEGELEEFLTHPVLGLEKFLRFYQMWAEGAREVSGFHLLKYEDMRAEPEKLFSELLRFLGIPVQEATVRRAVKDASFESMKTMEASGRGPRYRSSGLDIFGGSDPANLESFHVRKGQVGGYREYLKPQASNYYENLIGPRMPLLYGYQRPPH
jgi:hypothetical protein